MWDFYMKAHLVARTFPKSSPKEWTSDPTNGIAIRATKHLFSPNDDTVVWPNAGSTQWKSSQPHNKGFIQCL